QQIFVYELIAQLLLLAGEILRHRLSSPKTGDFLGHTCLRVSCILIRVYCKAGVSAIDVYFCGCVRLTRHSLRRKMRLKKPHGLILSLMRSTALTTLARPTLLSASESS